MQHINWRRILFILINRHRHVLLLYISTRGSPLLNELNYTGSEYANREAGNLNERQAKLIMDKISTRRAKTPRKARTIGEWGKNCGSN
jgi:hypothetical protein